MVMWAACGLFVESMIRYVLPHFLLLWCTPYFQFMWFCVLLMSKCLEKILTYNPLCIPSLSLIYSGIQNSLVSLGMVGFLVMPWTQGWKERPVFGKIRYMNLAGCKRKFNVDGYIMNVNQMVAKTKKRLRDGTASSSTPKPVLTTNGRWKWKKNSSQGRVLTICKQMNSRVLVCEFLPERLYMQCCAGGEINHL